MYMYIVHEALRVYWRRKHTMGCVYCFNEAGVKSLWLVKVLYVWCKQYMYMYMCMFMWYL